MNISAVHIVAVQEKIRGCPVVGKRNIVDSGNAHQCLDVRIMRLRFQWIAEKDDQINFAFRDPGAHFLISAKRTALVSLHRESGGLGDQPGGGSGTAEEMTLQYCFVFLASFYDIVLQIVVCDEGDSLLRCHFYCFHYCHDASSPLFAIPSIAHWKQQKRMEWKINIVLISGISAYGGYFGIEAGSRAVFLKQM